MSKESYSVYNNDQTYWSSALIKNNKCEKLQKMATELFHLINTVGYRDQHFLPALFKKYDIKTIIKNEKDSGDNNNVLLIFDDLIRDISGKKGMYLEKLILNRRHAIQNKDNDKVKSGLTIFITSQSYNMLPLRMRKNLSDIVLFSSTNAKELNSIKDELMYDLDKNQQNNILKHCWNVPYGFVYIKSNATTTDRYYQNFNKIVI